MASKPDDSLGPLTRLARCPGWLSIAESVVELSWLMSTAGVSSCGMVRTAAFITILVAACTLTGSVPTLVTLDD